MDAREYERICALTAYPSAQEPALSVNEEVFAVIQRQVEHRRLRGSLRQHRQEKTLKRYLARHGSCSPRGPRTAMVDEQDGTRPGGAQGESFCAIAQSVAFSPCMLARIMLEAKYGWTKTTISNLFKDVMNETRRWPLRVTPHTAPSMTPHSAMNGARGVEYAAMTEDEYDRVWREVKECIENDANCSPLADRVRHNMGLEYEYILDAKLRSRGLLFESEDMLREKGLSKTPDIRLVVPIGVRDADGGLHVVHWIDSKAMFGDSHTHDTENASQLQGYVNRFGPGMVIYWFGHVANLGSDRDIFITDTFPSQIELPGGLDPCAELPVLEEGALLRMDRRRVDTSFPDATSELNLTSNTSHNSGLDDILHYGDEFVPRSECVW